jgi:hypothetical protein
MDSKRNRCFESGSLQRRVSCEPDFPDPGEHESLEGARGEEEKVRLVRDEAERTALAGVDQVALGPWQGEKPPERGGEIATGSLALLINTAVVVGMVLGQRGAAHDGYWERCR